MASTESKVLFYKSLPEVNSGAGESSSLPEPPPTDDVGALTTTGTCTDAETFALRVLDDSMEPEFRRGCIVIIDPTGRATDGSFVLARVAPDRLAPNESTRDQHTLQSGTSSSSSETDGYVFRQLKRSAEPGSAGRGGWYLTPLNEVYCGETLAIELESVVGVIVQRAGTRRRYHKHYQ